jgi:hypothetical protein
MYAFIESIMYHVGDAQDRTWQWFNGLSREEWMVVLAVTCVCGFISLLGFQMRRL